MSVWTVGVRFSGDGIFGNYVDALPGSLKDAMYKRSLAAGLLSCYRRADFQQLGLKLRREVICGAEASMAMHVGGDVLVGSSGASVVGPTEVVLDATPQTATATPPTSTHISHVTTRLGAAIYRSITDTTPLVPESQSPTREQHVQLVRFDSAPSCEPAPDAPELRILDEKSEQYETRKTGTRPGVFSQGRKVRGLSEGVVANIVMDENVSCVKVEGTVMGQAVSDSQIEVPEQVSVCSTEEVSFTLLPRNSHLHARCLPPPQIPHPRCTIQ